MVGNFGEDGEASIKRLAEHFGCDDRLNVEGSAGRGEISSIYARTSVFVFPSLWPETMGIVGVEAMSQGVPLVASDVGGVREWLRDGANGFLLPPKDASAIAERVTQILESPDKMREMGESAIALAGEKFEPQGHVERLLEVYAAAAL